MRPFVVPASLLPLLCLAACHLVDQRDFNAHAGDKPALAVKAGPALRPVPSLVTIRYDTPDPPYQEALADAVQRALARKRDVLFTVTTLIPPAGDPPAQVAAEGAAATSGREIAEAIVADGADQGQVEQAVRQDPTVDVREVRVAVH